MIDFQIEMFGDRLMKLKSEQVNKGTKNVESHCGVVSLLATLMVSFFYIEKIHNTKRITSHLYVQKMIKILISKFGLEAIQKRVICKYICIIKSN